jgi:hypothetical protein
VRIPEEWNTLGGDDAVTTVLVNAPGSFLVSHALGVGGCGLEMPHEARECLAFDPVRSGKEPPPDRKPGRPLRRMTALGWRIYFAALALERDGLDPARSLPIGDPYAGGDGWPVGIERRARDRLGATGPADLRPLLREFRGSP